MALLHFNLKTNYDLYIFSNFSMSDTVNKILLKMRVDIISNHSFCKWAV